jgi:large subunit ribosomal protein L17
MRHGLKGKKLNVTSSHRKAMFKNMSVSLIVHEQIKTTLPKARAIRPVLEKLVTKAKRSNDLSTRRYLLAALGSDEAVNKLFNVLAKRYQGRPGGYLRIIKAGNRFGDMADVAYIEFVDRDEYAKGGAKTTNINSDDLNVSIKEDHSSKAIEQAKPKAKATKAPKAIVKAEEVTDKPKKPKTKKVAE